LKLFVISIWQFNKISKIIILLKGILLYLINIRLVPQFDSLKDRNQNQEVMKEARKFIQKLKEEDNKLDEINNSRPPTLWNHPDIE